MIFIYILADRIQHEFFIHFFRGPVIEAAEICILLDVSKMPLRLDGADMAFQYPLFTLDIRMGTFFQFFPLLIDLHCLVSFCIFFRIIFIISNGPYVHSRGSPRIYIPQKWLSRYNGNIASLEDLGHKPKTSPRGHIEAELKQIRRRLKKHYWTDLLLAYQELVE